MPDSRPTCESLELAARIELAVRPALPPPHEPAARTLIKDMIGALDDHFFEMHSSQGHERIRFAEVSLSGAFLMLDVVPEDIFVRLAPGL